MSIIFNSDHQPAAFYRNAIAAGDLLSPVLVEREEQISMEHAGMTFRNWCFDGFRLASNIFGQQRSTAYNIHNDIDAVKIYFNRKGRAHIRYNQLHREFEPGSGQFNMLYSAELDSRMEHIDHQSDMFSLQITPSRLEALAEDGAPSLRRFIRKAGNGRPVLYAENWQSITPAMDRCIAEILHCPLAGGLKKLYLHSKAVELLVLFTSAGIAKPDATSLPAAEREKLHFVKQYLEQHYSANHTLSSLAKVAELNEFKLKKGFKTLFGIPVIDFLIGYRLEKAREQLSGTGRSIAEVAYETGYTSSSYFGRAFKKKFGYSPGRLS